MNRTYAVDADITRASTIDSAFYHSDASYAAARELGTHHFHRLLCEFMNRTD